MKRWIGWIMVPLLFLACAGGPENLEESSVDVSAPREEAEEFQGGFVLTEEIHNRFSIGATYGTPPNSPIRNMFLSTVIRASDDPGNVSNLGIFVETEQPLSYYWLGEERLVNLRMVFSNLESLDPAIKPGVMLEPGQPLGTAGTQSSPLAVNGDLMISVYTLNPDVYMTLSTGSEPLPEMGLFWYNPIPLVEGQLPNPHPLHYEEVDPSTYDLSASPRNKAVRGYLSLDAMPAQDNADYLMLFISASLGGLIPGFEERNYSFTSETEFNGSRVITLWPEEFANILKEQSPELMKHIYVYGRKVGQDENIILLTVDLFAERSVEESFWQ